LLDPGVVAGWHASKHAGGGVSCSVCHGDKHTSKDDAEKVIMPGVESCMKCHETWTYPDIGTWFKEFSKTHDPPCIG
jgi:Cytochrome c7 and related cytochrome c